MTDAVKEAYAGRAAAPALRPFIDGYRGYRMGPLPAGRHRGVPSRYLTAIVSIGEPIRVLAQTDPAQPPDSYDFALAGLQLTSAQIAADGPQEGVTIELTPLGSRALLGLPAMALWNTTVEADAVLGRTARELRERLHEAPDWEARFAICDEVLGRCARRRRVLDDERLRGAWTVLADSGGTVGIGDLAAEVGWSRRHLSARFTNEFGLSPKGAARVLRFERACRLLRSPRRRSLADIAVACGYYDQSHLNRDFAALLGCSPLEWIAAEFPFFQDAATWSAPGSAA